jgi:hypothetical protein
MTGRLSIVALAALAANGVGASNAAAEEPDLVGPHVTRYQLKEQLAGAHRVIRQGHRLPNGGCQFKVSVRVRPEDGLRRELELAYDPDTCRSLRVIGRPEQATANARSVQRRKTRVTATKSLGRHHLRARSARRGAVKLATPRSGVRAKAAQTAPRYYGFLTTWFVDPVGVHVNEVQTGVNWAPDGACAMGQYPDNYSIHDWDYSYFEPTFWYLESATITYGLSSTDPCSNVFTEVRAHFGNTAFCNPFAETDTWHDPNRTTGLPDGSAIVTYVLAKSGDCADLLEPGIDYAVYQTA